MKPIKPKVLRGFGGRGAIGFGPIVFGDAVYGGAADFCTVKLDARSLKDLWLVDSGEFRVGTPIGDAYLVVVGRENVCLRSAADGKLLWTRRSYPAAFAWRAHQASLRFSQRIGGLDP